MLTTEDRLAIQELTARYALAMDAEDTKAWLETWSPDGVWVGERGTYSGVEGFAQLLTDLGERVRGKRHVITNQVIEGAADGARSICYMLIVDPKAPNKIAASAVYRDELLNEGGRWKFRRREMRIDR